MKEQAENKEFSHRQEARPVHILVVDDEKDHSLIFQQFFRKQVKENIYRFSFSESGGDALEVLTKSASVDLVLSDINMPGMSGLELLEEISERYKNIKVIIVSAYSDMDNIRRAMNNGAHDFITKPLDMFNVSLTIEKTIRQIRLEREKDQMMFFQSRMAQMGELLNLIAHQWRQPLNVINILMGKLLVADSLEKLDTEGLQKAVGEVEEQTRYMSKTIDDFSDFFKPTKQMESAKVEEVVENVLSMIAPMLEKYGIESEVKIERDLTITTFINEVIQVMMNLLKNSLDVLVENKPPAPRIKVTTERDDGVVRLCVEDNGGGMDDDVLHKIFQPYFSTKSKNTGTGLGLYMSKIIVENHCQGKIWGENRVENRFENKERGARFTIELPAKSS